MGPSTITGQALPNIPWEDKPSGCTEVVWRSSRNPLIGRNPIPNVSRIYNSAAVPFEGGFVGVFRCDYKIGGMKLHVGWSTDGYAWDIEKDPIRFKTFEPEFGDAAAGYDPRVVPLGDTYYVNWCTGYHGPTIGVAYTKDFKEFHRLENAFMPHNRNGVLFPEKIGGKFAMLSRPCAPGHCACGDVFYNESPDLVHWGRHRFVFPRGGGWQSTKVGAGPYPIRTTEGWLVIYHGVLTSCNGFVYSVGAAVTDIAEPWKVKWRSRAYILTPEADYECVGFVQNVVFPCAALFDADSGRITLYYGGADTYLCMAHTQVDELIEFVKAHAFPA